MNRKVYDAGSNLGHAALMQGLGGSGSVNKDQAAQKLGLLTKAGGFLKTDEEGKIPVSSVSSKALMLVPVSPKKHYVDEKQVYHVPGMTALKVTGVPGGVTATVVDSSKLEVTSTSAGEKIFFINGVQVGVAIHAVELVAPILEKGQSRISTVNQRSKTLILEIGEQPESLMNSIVSVEWDVRDALGALIDNPTTTGTTYVCTVPEQGQFRVIKARLNTSGTVKSPWSNPVLLDFYPAGAWVEDPVANGARYGCFADQRIAVDNNFGREVNIIEFTELGKPTKDVLKTIEKPVDAGTFFINPREGSGGDILSLCLGSNNENLPFQPRFVKTDVCVFNHATDGYTKEQAGSTQDLPSLKSSSRKARKLPRLQKDGVFYKVDATCFGVSKDGTRIVGSIFGENPDEGGRYSGYYSYKKISNGSYIQEHLRHGDLYVFDVDVSQDGNTFIHVDKDTFLVKIARYSENFTKLTETSVSIEGAMSVKFCSDERFAVVNSLYPIPSLVILNVETGQTVASSVYEYSVTRLPSETDQGHRIVPSLDRSTFVVSSGESFTAFRVVVENDIPTFEILLTDSGIDLHTGRVSKFRSDNKVLLSICEPVGTKTKTSFSYRYTDNKEAEDKVLYPVSTASILYRTASHPGFVIVGHTRVNYRKNLTSKEPQNSSNSDISGIAVLYMNFTTKKYFYRISLFNATTGTVILEQDLLPSNEAYYSYNALTPHSEIELSSDLEFITIVCGHNLNPAAPGAHGRVLIYKKSGSQYVPVFVEDAVESQQQRSTSIFNKNEVLISRSDPNNALRIFKFNEAKNIFELRLVFTRPAQAVVSNDYGVCSRTALYPDANGEYTIVSTYYPPVNYGDRPLLFYWKYNSQTNQQRLIGSINISLRAVHSDLSYYFGTSVYLSPNGRFCFPVGEGDVNDPCVFILNPTGIQRVALRGILSDIEIAMVAHVRYVFDTEDEDCFYILVQRPDGSTALSHFRVIYSGSLTKISEREIVRGSLTTGYSAVTKGKVTIEHKVTGTGVELSNYEV